MEIVEYSLRPIWKHDRHREGATLEALGGTAAYIFMTDPKMGKELLAELSALSDGGA